MRITLRSVKISSHGGTCKPQSLILLFCGLPRLRHEFFPFFRRDPALYILYHLVSTLGGIPFHQVKARDGLRRWLFHPRRNGQFSLRRPGSVIVRPMQKAIFQKGLPLSKERLLTNACFSCPVINLSS